MKQLTKYVIAILLVVTALSSSMAQAAPGERGRNGRGVGGEVGMVHGEQKAG
ncbi:MAG: hypothetical protein ACPGWR_17695 [Ardenticatenaceae bacterium]